MIGQFSYTGEWLLEVLPEGGPEVDLLRLGLPEMLPAEANSFPGLLVGLEGTVVIPLVVGPGMTVTSDWLLLGLVTVTLTGLLTGLG